MKRLLITDIDTTDIKFAYIPNIAILCINYTEEQLKEFKAKLNVEVTDTLQNVLDTGLLVYNTKWIPGTNCEYISERGIYQLPPIPKECKPVQNG